MYRCPTCKSPDHLQVVVEVWAKLIQPANDPEAFETTLDDKSIAEHGHEWTGNSVLCANPECATSYDTHIAEHFQEAK